MNKMELDSKRLPSFMSFFLGKATGEKQNFHYEGSGGALVFSNPEIRKQLILKSLLSDTSSTIIHDPDGYYYDETAKIRAEKMGHKIVKIDILETIKGPNSRINILDSIRIKSDYETIETGNVAKMLCDPQGLGLDTGSDSDHWRKTAYAFLTGAILHILYSKEIPKTQKNLSGLNYFFFPLTESSTKILYRLVNYEHDPELKYDWKTSDGTPTKTHPVVANMAKDMLDRPEGELGSIFATVRSCLELYRNPMIEKNTACTDYDIWNIAEKEATTVYILNYPKNYEILHGFLKMILETTFQKVTTLKFTEKEIKKTERKPLLILLDEWTTGLGKMNYLINTILYLRAYNVSAFYGVNNLPELENIYNRQQIASLWANNTILSIGVSDTKTAERISQTTGLINFQTIARDIKTNEIISIEKKRANFTANEILQLLPNIGIIAGGGWCQTFHLDKEEEIFTLKISHSSVSVLNEKNEILIEWKNKNIAHAMVTASAWILDRLMS